MAHKSDYAKEHIETAICLFEAGASRACVLTLAGAAEEVLGNLLSRQGVQNMLARLAQVAVDQKLEITPQQVYRSVTQARNAMKHAKDPMEYEFELDPDEATAMLTHAMINFQLFTGALTPPMEAFLDNYLRKNWLSKYPA